MDFYGPRIPIGGGALSGKHLSHIDRVGAYAPNRNEPLDISYEMVGRGRREGVGFFEHSEMLSRYRESMITIEMAQGRHFFDVDLPWNGLIQNGKQAHQYYHEDN